MMKLTFFTAVVSGTLLFVSNLDANQLTRTATDLVFKYGEQVVHLALKSVGI